MYDRVITLGSPVEYGLKYFDLPMGNSNDDDVEYRLICVVQVYDNVRAVSTATVDIVVKPIELLDSADSNSNRLDSIVEKLSISIPAITAYDGGDDSEGSGGVSGGSYDTAIQLERASALINTFSVALSSSGSSDSSSNTDTSTNTNTNTNNSSDSNSVVILTPKSCQSPDCNGNGVCVYIDMISLNPTPTCTTLQLDSECIAECQCNDDYYGPSCSTNQQSLEG